MAITTWDNLLDKVREVMHLAHECATDDQLDAFITDFRGSVSTALDVEEATIAELCAASWTSPVTTGWTSPQTGNGFTFYGTVQRVIREDDDGELLRKTVDFALTLNLLLVNRPIPEDMYFPKYVYRGSWLPRGEIGKFSRDAEYRVPMYLASSEDENIPLRFLSAFPQNSTSHVPVLFQILIDEVVKCSQVDFLEALTTCKNEQEWLFVPYSSFRVEEAASNVTQPTATSPIIIKIHAFPDNKHISEVLPLFFWH